MGGIPQTHNAIILFMTENVTALDIHCHLARINTHFKKFSDIKFDKKGTQLFYKLWAKLVRIKWSNTIEILNERFECKLLDLTNASIVSNFVILPLDGVYDEQGEIINEQSMFYTSNEDIVEFCKRSTKLTPAASINPNRKDADAQLELAFENECALIKWLPGLQKFDPAGETALAFARKCAAQGMPILIHLGQEFSFPGIKLEKKYHNLRVLTSLLETGCKIIVAHAGGFSFLREKRTVKTLEALATDYPNLYFDNSGMLVYQRRSRLLLLRKSPVLMSRIIFGTDYPCYAHTMPFVFNIKPLILKQILKTKNIFDRDYKIKKALGFNHEIFGRGFSVIYKKTIDK